MFLSGGTQFLLTILIIMQLIRSSPFSNQNKKHRFRRPGEKQKGWDFLENTPKMCAKHAFFVSIKQNLFLLFKKNLIAQLFCCCGGVWFEGGKGGLDLVKTGRTLSFYGRRERPTEGEKLSG